MKVLVGGAFYFSFCFFRTAFRLQGQSTLHTVILKKWTKLLFLLYFTFERRTFMNFGVSTASFYPLEPENALKQLGEWKIPNIEVFINAQCELNPSYLKTLRKNADEYNISIISLHPFTSGFEPMLFFTDYERRFIDGIENYKHYFQAMNILGAEIFVFHGDSKQNPIDNKIVFERFYKLCQIGREFGITVAHENVDRCKGHDINFFLDMRKHLHDDISLVFDNKQAKRGGVDYRDFIDKLGDKIVHVHLSDNLSDSLSNKDCCLPIGRGNADLAGLLTMLKDKKFNKAVLIELYNDVLHSNDEIYESYKKLISLKL